MPRDQITQGEIHDTAAFAANAKTYRVMPGIVTAYNAPGAGKAATVDVQPAVNDVRVCTTPDVPTVGLKVGQRFSEPWQVIQRVPVKFPTMGGFALWGPLKAGDRVLLLAFDLDPTTFLSTGQQSDPVLTRRNSGAHWVALPGDITDAGALPSPGSAICFGKPGGVMVTVDGSKVNLGAASPTDAVGLASLIDAAVTTIVSKFNAHTHIVAGTCPVGGGPLTGGLAAPTIATIAAQPSTASGTVKCQP